MKCRTFVAILLANTLCAVACLPVDTRPEPARVLVNVDLPKDLRDSLADLNVITFQTDDGWTVTIERLFVSMGHVMLDGNQCNYYEGPWYKRILNLSQPGPQKLELVFGISDCSVKYSVDAPDSNSVLGAGVSEWDRDFMVNAIVPVATPSGLQTAEGLGTQILGHATKDSVQISFDWGYSDHVDWNACRRMIDGKLEERLPLESGETTTVEIGIDPRNLFRAQPMTDGHIGPAPAAVQLMQLIADADQTLGNANGRVALDELMNVQVPGGAESMNVAIVMRRQTYPSMFVYGNEVGAECKFSFDDVDSDR